MIIKDIEFKLKDGRTAILRSANEKDAKALIEYMKKSTGETDFLLRTPEECETRTIERTQGKCGNRFAERILESGDRNENVPGNDKNSRKQSEYIADGIGFY